MTMKYLQIEPGEKLPDITELRPFRSIIVIDDETTLDWQSVVSDWLVKSGCLYMMAWGKDCSSWDDSVDLSNLKEFNYGDIPEEKFVMTTWHTKEPLKEVFWLSKNKAFHPTVKLQNTVILHISKMNQENKLLSEYANA